MLKRLRTLRRPQLSRRQLYCLGGVILILVVIVSVLLATKGQSSETVAEIPSFTDAQTEQNPKTDTQSSNKQTPTAPPKQKTSSAPPQPSTLPFMFGVGTELDQAMNHRVTKEAPVKLLTSWYNGSKDLGFMSNWRNNLVPKAYASGYSLHLIIYSNDAEQNLNTSYGPACGRPYPVSKQFLSDMEQLAQSFSGGKLYISMFTELQTYPCSDNTWSGGQNYYRTLKDQYTAAMNIFHKSVPGSQVSLSWGGWQTNWDDVDQGGGRSLFKYFEDVMNASDFQSFQVMANSGNLDIITNMSRALSPYNGGIMISHYKPDNGNQATFNADMQNIFTPENIAILQQNGLFAFSFMDTNNMNSSESTYQNVKQIIQKYAK